MVIGSYSKFMDLAVDLVACRCADFLNGECVRLKCAVLTKTPGFGNQKFSITVTMFTTWISVRFPEVVWSVT